MLVDAYEPSAEATRARQRIRRAIFAGISVVIVCAVVAYGRNSSPRTLKRENRMITNEHDHENYIPKASVRLTPLQDAQLKFGAPLVAADLAKDFGVATDGNMYGPFAISNWGSSRAYLNVAGAGNGATVNKQTSLGPTTNFYFENVGPWGIKNAVYGNYIRMEANSLTTRTSLGDWEHFLIFKQRWMAKDPTQDDNSANYVLWGEEAKKFINLWSSSPSVTTSALWGYLTLSSTTDSWQAVATCEIGKSGSLVFLNGFTQTSLVGEAQSRTFLIRFASSDSALDVKTKSSSNIFFTNLKNGEPVSGTAGPGDLATIEENWEGSGLSHLRGGKNNYAINGGTGTNLYWTNGNGNGLAFSYTYCYVSWRSVPSTTTHITMYISK